MFSFSAWCIVLSCPASAEPCTIADASCASTWNQIEEQERHELAGARVELLQKLPDKINEGEVNIAKEDALPSDWPDRALLNSMYRDILSDDEWLTPAQAQLTRVQEQLQNPESGDQLGDYGRWQPDKPWKMTYRQYVGAGSETWVRKPVETLWTLHNFGLTHKSMVLEIGCGALKNARVLITLLPRGHYHCIEPNRQLIQDGLKFELGYDQVQRRLPQFALNSDFLAPEGLPKALAGSDAAATGENPKYTLMVAWSIFTHTADDLFNLAISNLRPRFTSNTKLLATVIFEPCKPQSVREAEESESVIVMSNETSGWLYDPEAEGLFTCFIPDHLTELLEIHGLTWDYVGEKEFQQMVSIYLPDK